MGNKFIDQTKTALRCYCGHLMEQHRDYRTKCKDCDCEKYDRLPFDFFDRCPNDDCNSGKMFLPDTDREDVFICYVCESAYQFDGCEGFNNLTDVELKQLLESPSAVKKDEK